MHFQLYFSVQIVQTETSLSSSGGSEQRSRAADPSLHPRQGSISLYSS